MCSSSRGTLLPIQQRSALVFLAFNAVLGHDDITACLRTNALCVSQSSGFMQARDTEWVPGSGHAQSTRIEPVGGAVAPFSQTNFYSVSNASACGRLTTEPPTCEMADMPRAWATATEKRGIIGGSAVSPVVYIPAVPPMLLPCASTSASPRSADAQLGRVIQQRSAHTVIHDLTPSVKRGENRGASPRSHFDGRSQQQRKV